MYEIRITKTTIKEMPGGKVWEVIGKDKKGDNEYGYTPEITKKVGVEIKLYRQNVEELDLKAVIKAVNKM